MDTSHTTEPVKVKSVISTAHPFRHQVDIVVCLRETSENYRQVYHLTYIEVARRDRPSITRDLKDPLLLKYYDFSSARSALCATAYVYCCELPDVSTLYLILFCDLNQ